MGHPSNHISSGKFGDLFVGSDMKRILLIDNGYLDKLMHFRLDYRKIADHFQCPQCIVYDCVNPDSTRARFIDALRYLPGFTVKLGKLQQPPHSNGDYVPPVQKMVDVMLALDIVKASNRFDNVIVLTGDLDFVPAFDAARENMCEVTLVHINRVDQELLMAASSVVMFDLKLQEKCKMEGKVA